MTAKKTAHELLLAYYNEGKRVVEIDFDSALYGATDYLEKMAEADLGLEIGTVFKSITGIFNDRKIVGVVTPVGNIVFFERFTAGQNGVVVVNVPFALAGIIPTGHQHPEHMELMLGDYRGVSANIGKTLARVVNVVNNKPIFDKVERIAYVEEFEEVKSHGDVIKDILADDAKDKLNDVLALAATEPKDPQAVDDYLKGMWAGYKNPENAGFTIVDHRGDKGVICRVLDDADMPIDDQGVRADVMLLGRREPFQLPPESQARMAMTRSHAEAEIKHPTSISMAEIMDRVEGFLREANYKGEIDTVRIEELANMLPETGDRYRRAKLALIVATATHVDIGALFGVLRTCTQEEVSKWVVDAIWPSARVGQSPNITEQ